MQRSLILRVATLLLALLLPLTGIRAAAAARCTDQGCDMPCCVHDAGQSTVVPVLPCCRTVALDQGSPHPAPTTIERDRAPAAAPTVAAAPRVAVAVRVACPARATRFLPAPPLYHRHCALLL